MKNVFKIFPALILGVFFFSCQDNEEPDALLEQVGFEGTLPDGSEFGKTDIKSANGVTVSDANQKYNGSHVLSIRSFETGWSLSLETPRVEFDQTPPMNESDGGDLIDFFNVYYSYDLLLEKLSSEKQKAAGNPNYNGIENFRIVLTKQNEYQAYLPDAPTSQGVGKVRVLDVQEGIQKNLQGQDVRKIEVVVEVNLNLSASDANFQPQQGVLSGIARFKFREDFFQGEFDRK
ncbi:MAG: hypothetical protein ACJLTB_03950 [Algoriphagus aquaeductus]|uniref:hypothetical protein n=1 Tax=Algoriphagus aquaeductus TaxID=475299 RepID=UPI00387A3B36